MALVACRLLFFILGFFFMCKAEKCDRNSVVEDANYWMQLGQQLVQDQVRRQRYEKIDTAAKNVIHFLGDGMSITTTTASRIYKGQKEGATGEEASLTFEKFPHVALSKTYCTNAQVPDSACTAVAFLCGVKTVAETLGLDFNVEYKNCDTQNNPVNHVDSIMTWAQASNKGTGFVTTTRVTHATPAATYAHAASRDWEDDLAHSYANGPGYSDGTRVNLTGVDTNADSFKQQATVPLETESHAGDDVAIFAIGPQAHLFQGVYEQHYVAHVMAYATCIGPGLTFCNDLTSPSVSSSPLFYTGTYYWLSFLVIYANIK